MKFGHNVTYGVVNCAKNTVRCLSNTAERLKLKQKIKQARFWAGRIRSDLKHKSETGPESRQTSLEKTNLTPNYDQRII